MRCVFNKPDVFIAHDENPMDVLGIGANMVKALRYWLQAVNLTTEPSKGKRTQSFTDLGKLIFKYDTYVEELGTQSIYCSIGLLHRKKKRLHGTSSSTNFLCRNSQGKILLKRYRNILR